MKIDGNEKEKAAMEQFHQGNKVLAHRLQDEFVDEFLVEFEEKDHCSCMHACKYHGRCKECVAIHRAHGDHLPNCFRDIINDRIKILSELSEHTVANIIEPPVENLRSSYYGSDE